MSVSLGEAVLAFAGGAATQYNSIAEQKRKREADRAERIQNLMDMAQVKQAETMYNYELQEHQKRSSLNSSLRAVPGGPMSGVGQAAIAAYYGWDFNKLVASGDFGKATPPEVGDAPIPLTERLAALMASNFEPGRNKYADRVRPKILGKTYDTLGNGIPMGVIPKEDGSIDGVDVASALGFGPNDPAAYAEPFGGRTPEQIQELGRAMLDGVEPQRWYDPARGAVIEVPKVAGATPKAVIPENLPPKEEKPEKLDLGETKDIYTDENNNQVRLSYNKNTGQYYKTSDTGEAVPVDISKFRILPNDTTPSQQEKDYAKMAKYREMMRSGSELSVEEQDEMVFLDGKYSTAVPGPTIDMGDGTIIQETYARGPFGDLTNVSTFYRAGTRPSMPVKAEIEMAGSEIARINIDTKSDETEAPLIQKQFADGFSSLSEAEKQIVWTHAWSLAQHYLKGNGDKKFHSSSAAYLQAYEDIAQYYDPETKKLRVRQLYDGIQDIIGGSATDMEWVRETEKFIADNAESRDPKINQRVSVYRQALKQGVTSAEGWRQFLKKNSPR